MNSSDELLILKSYRAFLVDLENVLVNIPRKDYISRSTLYNKAIEVYELINYANTLTNRKNIQKKIIAKITVLDFYVGRLKDKKYIAESTYSKFTKKLMDITRMIYGWIKASN